MINCDGAFVRSAEIHQLGDRHWYLRVETCYGTTGTSFLTELAAKQFMGREFQTGGKWEPIKQ